MDYPKWSDIADLVGELTKSKTAVSMDAAHRLEDFSAQLHNTMAELESLQMRVGEIGCLIEECTHKAELEKDSDRRVCKVGIPQGSWFRLLQYYRSQQEGLEIHRELKLLREIAGITAETIEIVNNWLGHASTREAAMDSIWRLSRILESAGFRPARANLKWRGQVIRAMEEAGVGIGQDGSLRLRRADDRYWEPASGAVVGELLKSLPDAKRQ